jgi:hypothetical protein
MPAGLRFFAIGLPVVGMLSLPLTWLLLDQWKWILMPRFQPARAVLFVTVMAVILAMSAAMRAARSGRIPEALLWGLFSYAVPIRDRVSAVLLPDLGDPLARRRAVLAVLLAALAIAAAWLEGRRPRLSRLVWIPALCAPFFLIPYYGDVVNYPSLNETDIRALADWARADTGKDAVFLFPDAGKGLEPGIFRARALRALYVDWKGGGQVNMVKAFGQEWWRRWRDTVDRPFEPDGVDRFASLGIDYIVVNPKNRLPGRAAVFENTSYIAYRLKEDHR